jgi:hypothetical protein
MSTLEATVEELKSLSPAKLADAAGYIHRLKVAGGVAGRQALENAFGCLTSSEAEEMERAIASNCERIDASQW